MNTRFAYTVYVFVGEERRNKMIEIQIINDNHMVIYDSETENEIVMHGPILDYTLRELVEDLRD